MLQLRSIVTVADNTGAKKVGIFKVLGGPGRRYAQIGDIVVVSVKVAEPRKAVKKKDILKAVVVRQRNPYHRKDGTTIRFDDNAVVTWTARSPSGRTYLRPDPARDQGKGIPDDRLISTRTRMKIKKGDKVIMLSGKDRNKTGTVLRTDPDAGKVIVGGSIWSSGTPAPASRARRARSTSVERWVSLIGRVRVQGYRQGDPCGVADEPGRKEQVRIDKKSGIQL